ncbi:TetR/AcrR family transcriptional regulator [Paenibacillaceae bacterium]|nr:TetR/AcrR family transcriptional regulator [Paenibacillaceae bacterium]
MSEVMSSKTKDKIIHTAIQLFNVFGTGAVSTNKIAKELGMSPGNLYYHFHNKEEIIRAILDAMIADWDKLWLPLPKDWQPGLNDLKAIIRVNLQLQVKYRFFYRELITLMQLDPELKHIHQHIQEQRVEEQKKFFQLFVDAGIIQLQVPSEFDALLTACWIISNYWLSFLETSGVEVDDSQIEQGIQLIMTVLRPYIAVEELAGE